MYWQGVWFGPAFGLPDGLPEVGFLTIPRCSSPQTKNDGKQETIASVKELRASIQR
jgi:hypothetical protein